MDSSKVVPVGIGHVSYVSNCVWTGGDIEG